jgi:hypothetical protein
VNTTPSASEVDRPLLTRRQWFGQAPASALGTAVAMSLLGESALEAKPTAHASSARDLGARIYNIRDFGAAPVAKSLRWRRYVQPNAPESARRFLA